ncbi:outer membrane protein assembly factor BamD [Balneolaceae bacterium ANBcel3]|nr:outer membrane protein assembly factor BamD [Balneolaceae bacterium ANBcel3]
MRIISKTILLFMVLLLAASCASRHTIRPGDTLDVAFEKAMGLYERERYSQAAQAFETVLSIARGTELAADTQYYLAMSHYNNRAYLIAASEFRRFTRNHPNDERRKEAAFMEAYCHYLMSPRYNLDQTESYQAIDRFQLFISRYPGTDKAAEAAEYVQELRNKLAKKKFYAAEMYFRIREYRSAAVYYRLLVDRFPESEWTERAMVRQIEAYVEYAERSVRNMRQERYEQAIESYQQYVQTFPSGEKRPVAEEWYNRALDGLADVVTASAE